MKKHVTATAAALSVFLVFSSSVTALDLSGQSRTYLQSRETTDSSRLLPFFEYLDFRAEDIGSKTVSFHFGGWLRHDLREESAQNTRANSDLQYAYLRVRGEKTDADMDPGRGLVN